MNLRPSIPFKRYWIFSIRLPILNITFFSPMKLFVSVFLLFCVLPVCAQHTDLIRIDQFGYLPHAPKVAVLSDPQEGYNAGRSYTPGSVLEVRDINNGWTYFTGLPVAWNGGDTHAQSGDRVWWFDFSVVNRPGKYRIHDPEKGVYSDLFEISQNVYDNTLKDAVRMFYYQRIGTDKPAQYAGDIWADGMAFSQDARARLITDRNNPATERDLTGGWIDAGDYNKYTPWTSRAIIMLLHAYKENQGIWKDDYNIPESGNGIPDFLDEIIFGLEWIEKMQLNDGSLLTKNGQEGFGAVSPMSEDQSPRFYGAASTYATLSGAAVFALASEVFEEAGLSSKAEELRIAAIEAWQWAEANPDVPFYNDSFNNADPVPDDDYSLDMMKMRAAVYLFSLTRESSYRNVVDSLYKQSHPYQWNYWYGFESDTAYALAYYASLEEASTASVEDIRTSYSNSMLLSGGEFYDAFYRQEDAYRAFLKDNDTIWGSNSIKANVADIQSFSHLYHFETIPADDSREISASYLHYIHGVNPNGIVYLTYMQPAGAERSVSSMYHGWFHDGSEWDDWADDTSPYGPPPGYLVGGPNNNFSPHPSYNGKLVPPQDQPPLKAFRSWNTSHPQNSWEVTEGALGYQAPYVRLLANVAGEKGFREASPWKFFPRIEGQETFPTEGFGQSGLGWVYDKAYPFVFIRGNEAPEDGGSWYKLLTSDASLWGFFAYSYSREEWIWSNNTWGGWYYSYKRKNWFRFD